MNKQQRISTAKYLYDISKGFAILIIIGNIVQNKLTVSSLIIGLIGVVGFFMVAYILEGGIKNE